jgi:hypothetical protein
LTFGLGIIILPGVSRRKSLAGVNIMNELIFSSLESPRMQIEGFQAGENQ